MDTLSFISIIFMIWYIYQLIIEKEWVMLCLILGLCVFLLILRLVANSHNTLLQWGFIVVVLGSWILMISLPRNKK